MTLSRRSLIGMAIAGAAGASKWSLRDAHAAAAETVVHAPVSTPAASDARRGSLDALASALKAKPERTWINFPNTTARQIFPATALLKPPGYTNAFGVEGTSGVWADWNGAAYDPVGHKMYFWGGGHTGYGGNEVYSLDLELLQLTRLDDPSPLNVPASDFICKSSGIPVFGPSPWHTYGGSAWCPLTQSIFCPTFGGFCATGGYPDFHEMWEYKPGRKPAWQRKARKTPINPSPSSNGYWEMQWAPEQNKFLLWNDGVSCWYDPVPDTYTPWSPQGPVVGGSANTRDPATGALYFAAYHWLLKFLPTGPQAPFPTVLIKGQDWPNLITQDCGMDWDSDNKMLVFGDANNGGVIMALEPNSGVWRRLLNTGQTVPSKGAHVLTKWKYVSEVKAFVGYFHCDEGMWAYRPGNLATAPIWIAPT